MDDAGMTGRGKAVHVVVYMSPVMPWTPVTIQAMVCVSYLWEEQREIGRGQSPELTRELRGSDLGKLPSRI
jgi:hypothetical protein